MNDLFADICHPSNLAEAWQRVARKGKSGGIDGQSIADFAAQHERHLHELRSDLVAGQYVPEPYLGLKFPKKQQGEFRQLGLPTIRDKVAQQAAQQLLQPRLERTFLNVSYAYRPGRNTAKAIRRVLHLMRQEKRLWLVQCDIDQYFDSIPHERLLAKVQQHFPQEERLRDLIGLWIGMARVDKLLNWEAVKQGIPQGGVLSPLLANLYLHDFDQEMVKRGNGYVRYADDFVILTHKQPQAEGALRLVQAYLPEQLGLQLNPGAKVIPAKQGFAYLGVQLSPQGIRLTADKLLQVEKALGHHLRIREERLDPDGLRELAGIRAHYHKLIPPAQLEALDEALAQHLSRLLTQAIQKKQLKRRSLTPKWLVELIPFAVPADQRETWYRQVIETAKAAATPQAKRSEQKIKQKRREYEEKAAQARELLVQTPGSTLGKHQARLAVRKQGKVLAEAPLRQLQHVTIQTAGVSLSSNLVRACAEHQVRIDFLDGRGTRYAWLEAPRYPNAALAVAQVEAYTNGKGANLARHWVMGKLRNQANLVRYFEKNRRDDEAPSAGRVAKIRATLEAEYDRVSKIKPTKILLEELRGQLMAAEGRAAEAYWSYFKLLLSDKIDYPGRRRQGAKDPVNSALNYGYGILYGRMYEALRQARLMPVFSYLHSPGQRDQPTLSYDFIEPFRAQAVDRVVWAMLRKGVLPVVTKAGQLSDDSRHDLARRVLERLGRKETFRGERLSLDEIIIRQAREVAQYLTGEAERYRPYIAKW